MFFPPQAAATSSTPALPAAGTGPARDPSPPGPESAERPAHRHFQLCPVLPLQHPGITGPARQGGQERQRRLRQPPRRGRRQVRLDASPPL